MKSAPLQLRADGYLYRDGQWFLPVGVNYWPSSCGTEMWTAWPEAEIRADLQRIAGLGLNALRFFLRWDHFQPTKETWNPLALDRLEQFLGWCAEAGIYAQPTLFVGWMSGAIFWPEWKADRNLFTDLELRNLAAGFAERIAGICRKYDGIIMGIDLGNELCCLPESRAAAPGDIAAWSRAITDAVRRAYPETWLIAGNEQSQIAADCGWRLGQEIGTDCLSMHAYPVPGWHPLPFDGMRDPFVQSFLPFYVKAARAFGPVMVQEFGTILTQSPGAQRDYLTATLNACLQEGANGFLYWCWSDFTCNQHPYKKTAFEKDLGLTDAQGRVKNGLDHLLILQKEWAATEFPARTPEVALYWPKYYYMRDCQENPGNTPAHLAPRLLFAHYSIERAGFPAGVIRHETLKTCRDTKVLVITGAVLDTEETAALQQWVEKGGRVLWHGTDPMNMGPEFRQLTGFAATDFRLPGTFALECNGQSWSLDQFPHGTRVDVELRGGESAYSADGTPLGILHRLGKGAVLSFLPDVEGCAMRDLRDLTLRDRWSDWYGGMIRQLLALEAV